MPAEVFVTAVRTLLCDTGHGRRFLFVLVDTSEGITGVGEGSQNDQDAAVIANLEQLAPGYIGQDPLNLIERHGRRLLSARTGRAVFVATSAIEQALWDIAGKLLGVPVFKLLGGSCQARLRCYATIWAGVKDFSEQGLAGEAEHALVEGFGALKVVPFRGLTQANFASPEGRELLSRGVRILDAVRTAVGREVEILIECQGAYDFKTALRIGEAVQRFDPLWFEAPLKWDDEELLSRLREQLPMRLASGEALHGRQAFRPLIEGRAVDVLQPDVKWTGGILEAKKVAAWAETYQLLIAPHNNSGPVATAASAQLCATLPNFLILEVPSRGPDWESDLLGGGAQVREGQVEVGDLASAPGLGIQFNEAVARRHAIEL